MSAPHVRRAVVLTLVLVATVALIALVVLFTGCSGTVSPTLPSPEGGGALCTSALINPPDNSGGNIEEGTGGDPEFIPNDPTLDPPTFPDPIVLPSLGDIPSSSQPYEPGSNETLPGGEYNYADVTIDGVTVWYQGSTTLTCNGTLFISGAGRIRCTGDLEIRVLGNVTMDGGQIFTEAEEGASGDLALKCGGGMELDSGSIRSEAGTGSLGGGVLVAALGGSIQGGTYGPTIVADVTPSSGPSRDCTVLARDDIVLSYGSYIQVGTDHEASGGNVFVGTLNGGIWLQEDARIGADGGASGHAVELRSGGSVTIDDEGVVYQRLGDFAGEPTGVRIYALNGDIEVSHWSEVYAMNENQWYSSGDVLLQANGEVVLGDDASIYTGSAEVDSGDITIIGYRCGDGLSPAVGFTADSAEIYTGNAQEGVPGNVEIQGFVSTEGDSDAISWGQNSISTGQGIGGGGGDVILRTRCCNGG